jgi:hypothetical protein
MVGWHLEDLITRLCIPTMQPRHFNGTVGRERLVRLHCRATRMRNLIGGDLIGGTEYVGFDPERTTYIFSPQTSSISTLNFMA